MRSRSPLVLVAIALVALAAAWGVLGRGDGEQAVTEHPVTVPEIPRIVTVSATMPAPSAAARHLSALLEKGVMPSRRTMAEVMSDTECTPDARMISRCRNEVRLRDGSTMVLRHPHDMRDIPCLAPGETVMLVPASVES